MHRLSVFSFNRFFKKNCQSFEALSFFTCFGRKNYIWNFLTFVVLNYKIRISCKLGFVFKFADYYPKAVNAFLGQYGLNCSSDSRRYASWWMMIPSRTIRKDIPKNRISSPGFFKNSGGLVSH